MPRTSKPKLKRFPGDSLQYNSAIYIRVTEEQKGKINVVARHNNQSTQSLLRELINNEIGRYEWEENEN